MAMKCNYVELGTGECTPLSPGAEYKLLKSNLTWNWPEAHLLPEMVSSNSFLASLPSFRGESFISDSHRKILDFNEHLSRQALEIFSRNNTNVDEICTEFFKTSIAWFPIMDKDDIFDRLPNIHTAPDAQLSVLLMCIYLFTRFWRATSDDSSTIDLFDAINSVYFAVKGFHSLLLSTGRISIDSIQAGILLAMYEQCQYLRDAAELSIATCARMGYTLGLDKTLQHGFRHDSMTDLEVEIRRRLWWTILMIER